MNLIKLFKLEPEDLTKIQFEVFRNRGLFDEFTLRQEFLSDHSKTKTIPLRMGKSITPDTKAHEITMYSAHDELEFEDWESRKRFPMMDYLINGFMKNYGLVELGWLTIVKLDKHSSVGEHIDEGEYCKQFHRFHLCIDSGEDNQITVDDNQYNIAPGDLFVFDNKKTHSAFNGSDTDRTHLIFDAR